MSSSSSSSLSSSSSSQAGGAPRAYPLSAGAAQFSAVGKPAEATLKIPVTLPSLKVAWMEIPYPLSEDEYKTLANALATYKVALTTIAPGAQGPPEQLQQ